MSTTSIFAEIFVGGVQASIWVVLLGVAVGGAQPQLDVVAQARDWTALVTLLAIALLYALGVLVDRLADGATGWLDRRIERHVYKGALSVGEARLHVARTSEGLTKHLEYIRSRMRVARVTVFNALSFTFVVPVFAWRTNLSPLFTVALVGGGLAVLILATFSWRDTTVMFYTRLAQALELVAVDADHPERVVVRTDRGYEAVLRSAVHRDGRLHFCVHLMAVRNTAVFLQLRSAERRRNANKWTSTVSGHITAADAGLERGGRVDIRSGLAALAHETREELGVDIDVMRRAKYIGQVAVVSEGGEEICNCIALIFTISVRELDSVKTPEVQEVAAFEMSEVSDALASGSGLRSATGERFGFADNFAPVFRCLLDSSGRPVE